MMVRSVFRLNCYTTHLMLYCDRFFAALIIALSTRTSLLRSELICIIGLAFVWVAVFPVIEVFFGRSATAVFSFVKF